MELIRRTPAKRLDTVAASSGAADVTFRFGDDVFIKVLQRMVSIYQAFRLLAMECCTFKFSAHVQVCVASPKLDGELVAVLLGEFADDYDDVRYFLVREIALLLIGAGWLSSLHACSVSEGVFPQYVHVAMLALKGLACRAHAAPAGLHASPCLGKMHTLPVPVLFAHAFARCHFEKSTYRYCLSVRACCRS
jgi:hypothetical protein